MNQRGFATLEVILMVMVIGILASIAVPRFTSVTTAANTAKIQADLSTIDTAIDVYSMENGTPTSAPSFTDLAPYLKDSTNVKPPTGKAFVNGTETPITDKEYKIESVTVGTTTSFRARLDNHTAGEFTKTATTTTTSGGGTGGGGDNPG